MGNNGNGRQASTREFAVFGPLDPVNVYPEGHPDAGDPLRLPVDPGEVDQMASDLAVVQRMIGGTLQSGADREINPFNGLWDTTAMYWQWHSFSPSSRHEASKRGKRGGQQQQAPAGVTQQRAAAAEAAMDLGAQPQEPEPEELDDDFMPLSEDEERAIAALEAQGTPE